MNTPSREELVERVAAMLKKQRRDRYAQEAVAGDGDLVDREDAREIINSLPIEREEVTEAAPATVCGSLGKSGRQQGLFDARDTTVDFRPMKSAADAARAAMRAAEHPTNGSGA
jgi:hypothetical protein